MVVEELEEPKELVEEPEELVEELVVLVVLSCYLLLHVVA